MAKVIGGGAHQYEVIEDWGTLPPGWSYGEVAAVGVDSRDNVYVFNRGEHPMIVFDRAGNFLRSWGEGLFPRAHGVHMAFVAASASGRTASSSAVASKGLRSVPSAPARPTSASSSVSIAPAVRITRT